MEAIPWDIILVDIIVPYKLEEKIRMTLSYIFFAVIEYVNRWFKIVKCNNKQKSTTSNLVDQAWLCIYTRPEIII